MNLFAATICPMAPKLTRMYKTCRELPLWNFVEISETGDLKYLLESNNEKASNALLKETYDNILDEYYRLSKDDKFNKRNKLKHEIIYFTNKVDGLCSLYNILVVGVDLVESDKELAIDLCNRYRTKFDLESLDRSISGAKNKLALKQTEYDRGKVDEKADFDESFVIVQKEYGMQIDKRKTSVSEWVSIVNRIKAKASA